MNRRTNNLSGESRKKTIKKTSPLASERTPKLPLIKDAVSPVNSSVGLTQSEEIKHTPKIKRSIKSQIAFSFTNKTDELKLKSSESIFKPKIALENNEHIENEEKNKLHQGVDEINRLNQEIKSLQSALNDKVQFI